MQATVEVVFDHLDASEALRERIHEEVEALEKIFGRFTSCRVVVATHTALDLGEPQRLSLDSLAPPPLPEMVW
jgi:ribosome-associated translation inhibitor RaiA